jgi:hypothetical protein
MDLFMNFPPQKVFDDALSGSPLDTQVVPHSSKRAPGGKVRGRSNGWVNVSPAENELLSQTSNYQMRGPKSERDRARTWSRSPILSTAVPAVEGKTADVVAIVTAAFATLRRLLNR